ncbi:MAG: restriction endonuclease subunit S [Bacteroidetes bacterium]|nr:restriction endonuclease subunit S [Bacteroidota bacterium]
MSKTYDTIESISKSINSGITPLRSNSDYWTDGVIPWLKTEQLGEFQIKETNEKISKKALEETGIKINPANTISIALYGEGRTRGNVSILKTPMTTNQACCNIVVNDEVADYRYVYYWLKNNYHQLRNLSSGVRKNLSADEIKSFPFNCRKPNEQASISEILSTLDLKISLNNSINTELETMAKAIYNYWFTQFDFPNEEGKPYKESGGELEFNEELKKEIPLGWGVKIFDKFGEFKNGINYEGNVVGDKVVRIVNVRDISNTTYFILKGELDEISLPEKDSSRYLVHENDILIARSGTPGATRLIHKDIGDVIYCGFIIRFNVYRETQELITLRDFLLPLLMNGQVKLK